jgi:hypothetical protein
LQSHSLLFATVLQLAGLTASPFTPVSEDYRSELIPRYLAAMEARKGTGECQAAEVTVRARLSGREAELHAVRNISATGAITHRVLDSSGDSTVRREVIGRYLEAEGQATQLDEIAITPSHYRFRFLRTVLQAGRRVLVFQLSPRQLSPKQKRVGLFKGELWLDSQTALPVRESGQFVKSPSVFVKRIVFIREYRIEDGAAIPDRIAATVDTRLAGRAELSVQFDHVVPSTEPGCP